HLATTEIYSLSLHDALPIFFGTFAFSWVGLTVIPSLQIGALNPQMDEEGGDTYPAPKSGMAEQGRHIYAANGCIYCHSQQVRPEDRKSTRLNSSHVKTSYAV